MAQASRHLPQPHRPAEYFASPALQMPYPLTPVNPNWAVVILAAGQGTRLGPGADKALTNLAGISMIEHLFRTCIEIDPRQVVVVRRSDQRGLGEQHFPHEIVIQDPTLAGTGAALLAAEESIFESVEYIAVLFVDNPLLTAQRITNLIGDVERQDAVIGLTTALDAEPGSRGRIIRMSISCSRSRIPTVVPALTDSPVV